MEQWIIVCLLILRVRDQRREIIGEYKGILVFRVLLAAGPLVSRAEITALVVAGASSPGGFLLLTLPWTLSAMW